MGERWDVWVNGCPVHFPDGCSDAVGAAPVTLEGQLTPGQSLVSGGEICDFCRARASADERGQDRLEAGGLPFQLDAERPSDGVRESGRPG